jgi:hypothetical protein
VFFNLIDNVSSNTVFSFLSHHVVLYEIEFFSLLAIDQHFLFIFFDPSLEVLAGTCLKIRHDASFLTKLFFVLLVGSLEKYVFEAVVGAETHLLRIVNFFHHFLFMVDLTETERPFSID